jgi:hypothetical protein
MLLKIGVTLKTTGLFIIEKRLAEWIQKMQYVSWQCLQVNGLYGC